MPECVWCVVEKSGTWPEGNPTSGICSKHQFLTLLEAFKPEQLREFLRHKGRIDALKILEELLQKRS